MPIITLNPSQAAYVDSGFPNTNSNEGLANPGYTGIGDAVNAIGDIFAGFDTYFNGGILRTWLEFNLGSIPLDATITDVTLYFNVEGSTANDYDDCEFDIQRSTTGFDDTTITWNNAPNGSVLASSKSWIDPFDDNGNSLYWATHLNPWIITIPTSDITSALSSNVVSYRIVNDGLATWAINSSTYKLVIKYDENTSTAAKIFYDGTFKPVNYIDERLPSVLDGLLYHYPLDGTDESTGTWNKKGNHSTVGKTSIQDVNHSDVTEVPIGTVIKYTGWFRASAGFPNNVSYYHYWQQGGNWVYQSAGYFQSEIGTDWTYIEKTITVSTQAGAISSGKQGVTVRNGSAAGTIEWRDCEIHFPSFINTNPQYSRFGLGMNDSTTNVLGDFPATDVSLNNITQTDVLSPYLNGNKVQQWTNTVNGGTAYRGWTFSVVSGLDYSCSAFIYDPYDMQDDVDILDTGTDFTNKVTGREILENGWKRIHANGTASITGTVTHGFVIYIDTSAIGNTFWISEPQIEQKSVPTAYTSGTRSEGVFAVTGSLNHEDGAFAFKYRVTKPTDTFTVIGGVNWWSNPISRDTMVFYRGTGWGSGDSITFLFFDGSLASNIITTTITGIDLLENHTLYFVVSYEATAGEVSVRIHDLTTNTSLLSQDYIGKTFLFNQLGPIYLGTREGSTIQNGWFSDLSVWDSPLTFDQLKTLINSELNISEDLTIVEGVKEHLNLPSGSYYFPLMDNSDTLYHDESPSQSTNLSFESPNGVFVGNATTNLYADGDYSSKVLHPVRNGPWTFPTDQFGPQGQSVIRVDADGTTSYHGRDITVTNGSVYNASCYCFVSTDSDSTLVRLSGEQGYSPDAVYDLTKKGTWQKISSTGTTTTTNARILAYQHGLMTTGYVLFTDVQFEARPFRTPFTLTSRSIASIEFNLNDSIGMDWNGDWTISYWKKPHGTWNNTLTGYSIESLGSNSNSVGGGYRWWGKNNGSNTIASSTPGTFTPSDYFDHWHMVTLVKSGTTVTIRTRGIKDIENSVRTYTLSGVVSNYYVNQYGYDFKLSGWDNGNPIYAFFRDLVIAKYPFSDSQQDNMYKQLSVKYNDATYIKNLIEKGT